MSFDDDFQIPFERTVTVKVAGIDGAAPTYTRKTYRVELLTTEDLLPWIGEMTEAARKTATDMIPERMKPAEIYAAKMNASRIECTPDSLRTPIAAGPGAIRVLKLAAKKIGLSDDETNSFVNGGGALQNQKDAFRAAAILTSEEFSDMFIPKPKEAQPLPNASGPSEEAA